MVLTQSTSRGSAIPIARIPKGEPGLQLGIVAFLVIFVAAVLGLYIAHQGRLLELLLPVGSLVLGYLLITHRPAAYTSYTLWTWFLTPLLRRLVDYRCGFVDKSLILAAPPLVTMLVVLALWRERPRDLWTRRALPFFLCLGGVAYGLCIAFILQPSVRLGYQALQWVCPIVFGMYVTFLPKKAQIEPRQIAKQLLIAAGVLSLYGIYQFYVMPAWDVTWLQNEMVLNDQTSFGRAEPGMLRVWSTVNSPGPFAVLLVTGIVLWALQKNRWKLPVILISLLALGLTLIRTEWLDLGIAYGLLLFSIDFQKVHKYVLGLFLVACCLPLFTYLPGINKIVADRIASFQNPDDISYQDRAAFLKQGTRRVLENPLGTANIAEGRLDNGFIDLFLSLGWPGGIAYLSGICLILLNPVLFRRSRDPFLRGCHARAFGLICTLASGNILVEMPGLLLWICLASYLSGLPQVVEAVQSETKSKPLGRLLQEAVPGVSS